MVHDHIPHHHGINHVIAVGNDVAKADDRAILGNGVLDFFFINADQPIQCFAKKREPVNFRIRD